MGSVFLASEMDNEKNKKQPLPQVSSLAILGLQSANSGGKAGGRLVPRHSFPQNLTLDKSQQSPGTRENSSYLPKRNYSLYLQQSGPMALNTCCGTY